MSLPVTQKMHEALAAKVAELEQQGAVYGKEIEQLKAKLAKIMPDLPGMPVEPKVTSEEKPRRFSRWH